MKPSTLIALLFICGIVFWVTGAGAVLGLTGTKSGPDKEKVRQATFFGKERDNPYMEQQTEPTAPQPPADAAPAEPGPRPPATDQHDA